jgi:transposase-like protein
MNLIEAAQLTEDQAREYIEHVLWPQGPVCPHCGKRGAWEIKGASVRAGLYKCKKCYQPFSVTVGTVMHGSHISIRQWIVAIHAMCSHKKGVSALQLKRDLGLGSYRSAWHLAHRIRLAMNEDPLMRILRGTVECDEAYFGGRPRKGNNDPEKGPKPTNKSGRGTDKAPVLALIERNGTWAL